MKAYSKQTEAAELFKHLLSKASQTFPKRPQRQPSPRGKIVYRLEKDTILQIIQDYESGLSGDQVAAKYDISRWTVINLVKDNGGTIRYRRLTPHERHMIAQLHAQGISQIEIAKTIHRSPSLVWHALNRTGMWTHLPK